MAILNRVVIDATDDNDKMRVETVQFFFGNTLADDSALIVFSVGRNRKGNATYRPDHTELLPIANGVFAAYRTAMTKNIQKSAEDFLVAQGLATL